MKRQFYISVDGVLGPFETLAEAEFWAENTLSKQGKLPNKRKRQVKVLELVLTKEGS